MVSRTSCSILAAAAIHARLVERPSNAPSPELPVAGWQESTRLVRLIQKAQRQRLYRAELKLQTALRGSIQRLSLKTSGVLRALETHLQNTVVTSAQNILADLRALEMEFEIVEINVPKQTVSVETEPICLEGFELGRFQIVWDWRFLRGTGAYEVIALDPNPAATDDDTTHPHVQSNALCEGEGKVSIRKALADGRLFDFFILIRQILQTYNSSSAYVRLDEWDGFQCPDCDSTSNEDESSICEGCSTRTCGECSYRCHDCEYFVCSGCIRTCTGCDNDTCSSCRSACAECGDGFCGECLNDNHCPLCREEEEEAQPEPPATITAPVSSTHHSVHTVRVGETTLPEGCR